MTETLCFEVDGTEVLVDGDGPGTVVMLHGWPDTRALWDDTVARLAPRWRCVRFTLPGCDLERAPRAPTLEQMTAHLAAIVDAVSPAAPVVLLLHDWGAFYGYQYAMRHPQRVARIVGVDVGDAGSPEHRRSLTPAAQAGIAAYQLWLAIAYLAPAVVGDPMTRWMARRLRAPAPVRAIGARMNFPYAQAWSGRLRGAVPVCPSCPVLYLYGERKPFMFHSPQWLERLSAAKGSAVHALRAGHWVMVNRPQEFGAIIDAWLAGGGA